MEETYDKGFIMAQLNLFDGGLNTRLSKHLLKANEGTIYKNIDNSSCVLKPLREDKDENIRISPNFYKFNNKWISDTQDRDYVEFQEKLYYSDGSIAKKSSDGITWYKLGIDKPVEKLVTGNLTFTDKVKVTEVVEETSLATLEEAAKGDLTAGTHFYRIVLSSSTLGYSYTIKANLNLEEDAKGIKIKLSKFYGKLNKMTVYRSYLGSYKKVGETTTTELIDSVEDISAGEELVSTNSFSNTTSYYIKMKRTSDNVERMYKEEVEFTKGKAKVAVAFYPLAGYTFEVYRAGYKVNLSYNNNNNCYYDLGDLSDIQMVFLPEGTYQYCYTYYNENDGTESMPSDYSNELEVEGNAIRVTVVKSACSQVTHIRIYRLGGTLLDMYRVTELPNINQTYIDNLGDADIDMKLLDSQNNGPAPVGLKYLTESNAMFFGAVKDKLYFSDIGFVNHWSPYNFIDFDSDITGIGEVQNGLLVFTKFKAYIVSGNGPGTLTKFLLNGRQGCLLHKSIQYISNMLVWLSDDGVCSSAGGDVLVITRTNLGKFSLKNPKCSDVYNDCYYLSHDDGTLVLDFRYGMTIREKTQVYEGLGVFENKFYGVKNNKLYHIEGSEEPTSIHYRSPILIDNSISQIKNFKNIYVFSEGNMTFKTYLGGELVSTKELTGGYEEVKLPQAGRLDYYIEFEVIGSGCLVEIEYKFEGRQNGR